MSEGSDEYVDAVEVLSMPDHEFDEQVIEWIRDAKLRLRERDYGHYSDGHPDIYVGEKIYYEALSGDYFDVREEVELQVYKSTVYKWSTLPDYRVMVVDVKAMKDVHVSTGPSVMHDVDPSDPAEFDMTETTVDGQIIERPDAIEFVPETEVYYGDV